MTRSFERDKNGEKRGFLDMNHEFKTTFNSSSVSDVCHSRVQSHNLRNGKYGSTIICYAMLNYRINQMLTSLDTHIPVCSSYLRHYITFGSSLTSPNGKIDTLVAGRLFNPVSPLENIFPEHFGLSLQVQGRLLPDDLLLSLEHPLPFCDGPNCKSPLLLPLLCITSCSIK
jgi:hypothetical protein